ncbi:putative Zn(2)-C6 fungal-type domain-containing protein [Seiridium cardinale]|uniref:Zn(2)-C6 fungal-type domain-containing protein n=1 Tax=Seiridium cardinale TaxID=138064 RepID=A0ABR2XKS9_9PEZI
MSGESNDPSAYPALAEAVEAVQESQSQHPLQLQHQPQSDEPQDHQPPPPPADSPSQHDQQHHIPVALQYDGLQATAVAHHGLQALEAATAAAAVAPNPLAQQYAQSASMHVAEAAQYAPMTPQQSVPNGASMSPTPLQQSAQKVTRLRRACDMCSSRKVKCDESGPPCKPCRDLNVECTFSREMKRRGPPNKHAEAAKAAKRARADGQSPNQNAAEALASIGGQPNVLDADIIAPWPVLTLLVDDFFTYIHPLMPFPHEPTFRAAFNARADRTSTEFLALVASMVGVLVASFPRSARAHLKATHSTSLFPTAITMIERCRAVAMDSRGSTYMAKEQMTVDDAATSYFLGLSAAYTLQWKACKRYMAETMAFCREILTQHRAHSTSTVADIAAALSGANRPIDHIQDQITKRIFWVMVAGLRSMTQLGASINEIPLPPPTTQEPYPDLPVEVDDELIYPHQILAQPEGTTSLITGFNHNVNTYMAMNELVGVDMCYGINFFEWSAQKSMLSNALSSTKAHLERLPDSLQIKIDPTQLENGLGAVADDPNLRYYPPAFPATQPPNDVRHSLAEDPNRRRRLQLEIQKANIYASQLATRSYFVERYLNLHDSHKAQSTLSSHVGSDIKVNGEDVRDEIDNMVYDEREAIIKSLLTVLTSITQRNMEPNGVSLVNKIRQIASTLLNDAPERKGPVAKQAEEYLGKFLEILVKLERTGANTAPGTMTPQDEDEELQHWASLRDYQVQFLNSGGFLGGVY